MTALWLLLTIIVALVETVALLLPARGDTLSEQVWWLFARYRWARLPAAIAWAWLTVHFFFPRG